MAQETTTGKLPRFVLAASVCVVIASLYFARDLLIPIAMAILLTFLLAPLVVKLERYKVGRVPSVLIVVLSALIVVAAIGWVVFAQVISLASNIDQYRGNIEAKLLAFKPSGPNVVDKVTDAVQDIQDTLDGPATTQAAVPTTQAVARSAPVEEANPTPGTDEDHPIFTAVVDPPTGPLRAVVGSLSILLGPLGIAGVVIVLVFFMLLEREMLRDRLIALVGHGQLQITTQALADATTRITRYLTAQAIVNGSYGVAIALGLWLIGWTLGDGKSFPSFVLWGFLCAILRFVPYVGPWIAAAFPMAVSFAAFDGFGVFAAVVGMFVVIELLSNNFMEPMLYGSSTGMSTVAILIAAGFWTWVWGPIGLVLAIPISVCLTVMGKHVPQLRFLQIVLGDEPVLTPTMRVYQRLLAQDPEEAHEVVYEYLEKQSLDEVFDTVLIPVLAMAEEDQHAGKLEPARLKQIRQSMRDLIDEMSDMQTVKDAKGLSESEQQHRPVRKLPDGCRIRVVTLPANDEADEIVGLMLTQLLLRRNYCATNLSTHTLASEMIDALDEGSADIACISALPPSAVTHARYLYKRVQSRLPAMGIITALWTLRGDLKRAAARIGDDTNLHLSTTLHETLEQIDQLTQPLLLREKSPAGTSTQ